MKVLLPTHPSSFTDIPRHHHDANQHNPVMHSLYQRTTSTRKRKADDENVDGMSISPTSSPPAFTSRPLARPQKRLKSNSLSGHTLSMNRLLETLDAPSLRSVLQTICERHPQIGTEVISSAPRPSIQAVTEVLAQYQKKLQESFPYGGNPGSDYAFNRVKQNLIALIDALTDFTPHYLPPNETQVTVSLSYLDVVSKVVHDLPEWDSQPHRQFKDNAYDDLCGAWVLVITEASKRGAGFQLYSGGWDRVLTKHNNQSGGRMQMAIAALGSNLEWMGSTNSSSNDHGSIRSQILNGTYGNMPVSIGVGHF